MCELLYDNISDLGYYQNISEAAICPCVQSDFCRVETEIVE